MDIQKITEIFELMTGESNSTEYMKLIYLSMREIDALLRPNADISDLRLCFLCAALAFYRLQQILAARERAAVTYAGKVLKESQNTAYEYAKQLLRDYIQVCRELITAETFVFGSFSNGEEIL
jgi:predicted RNase H-like nuclease